MSDDVTACVERAIDASIRSCQPRDEESFAHLFNSALHPGKGERRCIRDRLSGSIEPGNIGVDLSHNVHRWYIPGIGSYSQPDPLLSVEPIAAYRYALSNPPPPTCMPSLLGSIGRGMAVAGAVFTVILDELFNPRSAGEPGIDDFTDPTCKPKCGDCDPVEHGILQAAVNRSCKGIKRSCSPGMSPQQLEANFLQNTQCYYARREIHDRCYRGGDQSHQAMVAQAAQAVIRCAELLTRP